MIGGEHYFQAPPPVANSLGELLSTKVGRISFFSTGRDALSSLLKSLPQKNVHLPDLICPSVYGACRSAGKEITTYGIGPDLMNEKSLRSGWSAASCMFVMHFFGITNKQLMIEARNSGMTVISDVTHSLFDEDQLASIANESDYLIASLRKSGPFPDGGFISSRYHHPVQATRGIREDFFTLRAAGLLSRGFSAESNFSDDENFFLLRKAERLINCSPPGEHQCSFLSQKLLFTLEIKAAAAKISSNIAALASSLEGICATPNNPGIPSPYFCCIFRNNEEREFFRDRLVRSRCFFPIHWDTSQLPSPSPLSKLCFSIPCDARYDEQDMHSVAKVMASCLNH